MRRGAGAFEAAGRQGVDGAVHFADAGLERIEAIERRDVAPQEAAVELDSRQV
jgi:hypothetical protein